MTKIFLAINFRAKEKKCRVFSSKSETFCSVDMKSNDCLMNAPKFLFPFKMRTKLWKTFTGRSISWSKRIAIIGGMTTKSRKNKSEAIISIKMTIFNDKLFFQENHTHTYIETGQTLCKSRFMSSNSKRLKIVL